MNLKRKSRIFVFVFSFLVWIALTSVKDIQEVCAGLVVAFLVSALAGQFLITTEKSRRFFPRLIQAVNYLIHFLWEVVKANFHVAYIVLHPNLPIKPGIVKIETKLTKESGITVLANSITLTPGTLTIDVDPDKKVLYIHWIDVLSDDTKKATESIGARFEGILTEVLE
jgi:multicomponent Na+:H+ antiporter subunit E